ncbi:hypothetical protein EDF62_0188 [Leucobacter luti]|uniref:Uncharacterized protein n=1 Tax=Leucobacter luti TaxID=340320 RepID=A0A4R6S6J2_9MICO|nr:hypothetical protein EDF62_0188 [Leucobacter luti]
MILRGVLRAVHQREARHRSRLCQEVPGSSERWLPVEFRPVAGTERRKDRGIVRARVSVPFAAELRARGRILGPAVELEGEFADSARPEPVHEHPDAV